MSVAGGESSFLAMQRDFYNQFSTEDDFKNCVVGCWDLNQKIPYVRWLLNYGGETDRPLFEYPREIVAIDYGCGIGRMVGNFGTSVQRVDGVDLGRQMIDLCCERYPKSRFWITDGVSFGEAPTGEYDLVFSTICLQHIPCHTVRMKIVHDACRVLKPHGKIALQMLYFDSLPQARRYYANIKSTARFSYWQEDAFDAQDTNSCHDVAIFETDLNRIRLEFERLFTDVELHIARWHPEGGVHQLFIYGSRRS